MDRTATEQAIKIFLKEINVSNAAGLAAPTEACANAENVDKGVEVALDIEQLAYEASQL